MTAVDSNEPSKFLGKHFDAVRSLRNHFSHPETNAYTGPLTHGYTVKCVSLLNTIFMPEKIFARNTDETVRIRNQFTPLHKLLYILTIDNGRFLVSGLDIRASHFVGGKWIYVLFALPVYESSLESFKLKNFISPFCFIVEDITHHNKFISAKIVGTDEFILLHRNGAIQNQKKFEKENKELATADQDIIYMHRMYNEVKIDEVENKFLYEYLPIAEDA